MTSREHDQPRYKSDVADSLVVVQILVAFV
jgi:hypothetical protein